MIDVPIDGVADLMRVVAAAELVPRHQALTPDQIQEKGPGDLVTEADRASEAALERGLLELIPDAAVLGEEGASAGTADWQALEADRCWVIDPLDGTWNFVEGGTDWGILVALVSRGVTEAAWLHAPNGDRMAIAQRGSGTTVDGRAVNLPDTDRSDAGTLLATRYFSEAERSAVEPLRPSFGPLSGLQSCVSAYLALLAGDLTESIYARTLAWDHAAGVLLHAEAGGHHATFAGEPYAPHMRRSGLVLARSGERVREIGVALRAT